MEANKPIIHNPNAFAAGDPITIIDAKARRTFAFVIPGNRIDVSQGAIFTDALIGVLPGARVRTTAGQIVAVYRTTLEEYVLLMPRAATVVPPKDIAFLVHWADVFPGATVVEAGTGSGALTLGLLRSVGEHGCIIGFELRPDHANRARKNIEAWPDTRGFAFDIRIGDIHQELGSLADVDRIILDLPDPQNALEGAAQALKAGGLLAAYVPGIRQIDALVQAALKHREFAEPEVVEVMARPWVADSQRLRPELRIIGHTGFLARLRRRGPMLTENDSQ
ncbi:MAG: methyltransferase domain-containing protein [Deltaproteobacteria bacterium]|nr:methyltransferase domain-containing protein [Deltaproteobacteria bacterium]